MKGSLGSCGFLARALCAGAFLLLTLQGCAARPTVEGAACACPEGYICAEGRCQKNACPCPSGFACTAAATCEPKLHADAGGPSDECEAVPTQVPPARFFPLLPEHYANALVALTGAPREDLQLPIDPRIGPSPFPSVGEGWRAGDIEVGMYRHNAEVAATAIMRRGFPSGICTNETRPGWHCVTAFAAQAFRRPLDAEESKALLSLLNTANNRYDDMEAVRLAVVAILQSPKFLYQAEIGPLPGRPGETQLTPYEIASALSFFLTDQPPDAELLEAAAAGSLMDPKIRAEHAERVLRSPNGRGKVARFVMQLLGMHQKRYYEEPASQELRAIADSMKVEASLFLEHHAWAPGASFATLFDTHETFVDGRLAKHYGLKLSSAPEGFQKVTIPERRGVLSTGRFLTFHPNPPTTLPVFRGFIVQERLLCEDLPSPPSNVDFQPFDQASMRATGRDRLNWVLGEGQENCASCHRRVGEISLGFEQFDELGRHRTHESGHLIDTRIQHPDLGAYPDGLALAVAIAESEAGQQCFVWQFLRFALAADVAAPLADNCLVKRIHRKWKAAGLTIPALFSEFIKDDAFITRNFRP